MDSDTGGDDTPAKHGSHAVALRWSEYDCAKKTPRGDLQVTTRVPRPRMFLASPQKRKKKISNRMKKSLMSLVIIY